MREAEKKRLYAEAIEVLVARHRARAMPDSPSAYERTVRGDLTARLRDNARALFNDAPEFADAGTVSPAELADMLEPVTAAPRPAESPNPSAFLPLVAAAPWSPLSPEEKFVVRSGLNRVRDALAETRATGRGRSPYDGRPDAEVLPFPRRSCADTVDV